MMRFTCIFTAPDGTETVIPIELTADQIKAAGAEKLAHTMNRTYPKAPRAFRLALGCVNACWLH